MNNPELENKLRAAREPVLEADYKTDFPRLVLTNLRSAPPEKIPAKHFWPHRLAWGLATAACVMIAFAIGHWRGHVETASSAGLLENTKLIRETLAMFPNRVRAITQDERGMNLVLSDNQDVPTSTPIYVRICDGKNCSSLVTFSGQEIQIAGQKLTVLSDSQGGIILEGNKFAWSSSGQNYAGKNLKIEAKNLGLAAM
jgi:hypothetical protein